MAEAKSTAITKAWNDFAGKEDEFKVVSRTDVNGVKTTALLNKLTGSLVAEVPAGEEDRLIDELGEPTLTVSHEVEVVPRTFIDDSGDVNEDAKVLTGDDAETALKAQEDEAAKAKTSEDAKADKA